MAGMSNEEFVELLYDRRLPKVYRDNDRPFYPFKRYIGALVDGGYGPMLKDIGNTFWLIDPENCPEEYLSAFVTSFGLPYYPDIPLKYQRRIVANAGALTRRRGTYAGVRFLVSSLTGMACDMEYFRGNSFIGTEEFYGCWLIVTCVARTTEEVSELEVGLHAVTRYLRYFVPYNITVQVKAVVAYQDIVFEIGKNAISRVVTTYNLLPQ